MKRTTLARHDGPGRFPIALRTRVARVDRRGVRQVLACCLESEGVEQTAVLGLLFCGDGTMRELNRTFRGKDRITDVLSFADGPVEESEVAIWTGDGPTFLGEIAVSLPQCLRQASDQGVDPGVELVRLLVHGALHVLGYDHIRTEDRRRMVPREVGCRRRCAGLGLGPGLLRPAKVS